MANFICEKCGIGFTRARSGARPIKYCSQKCYNEARKGKILSTNFGHPGFVPWNKSMKGTHFSANTEFKKGRESRNKLPVGSVQIRIDKNGKKRAHVKVAEPSVWKLRCVVVWEKHFGAVPKGMVIHHADRDTLNDAITNLSGLSRAAHLSEHRSEIRARKP